MFGDGDPKNVECCKTFHFTPTSWSYLPGVDVVRGVGVSEGLVDVSGVGVSEGKVDGPGVGVPSGVGVSDGKVDGPEKEMHFNLSKSTVHTCHDCSCCHWCWKCQSWCMNHCRCWLSTYFQTEIFLSSKFKVWSLLTW